MTEYASIDFDRSKSGIRLACTVDRATGELQALSLDQDAAIQDQVTIVASGVERASILHLPDNTWIIVYNVGTDLYARVTEDEGDSWGSEEALPVALHAATPGQGVARFTVAYLPRHKLLALAYLKTVSGFPCHHLTALRRDDDGAWEQGAETNLAGTYNGVSWTRGQFQNATVSGMLLPMRDGRLFYAPTAQNLGWFMSNFGWETSVTPNFLITNLSGPGLFAVPRFLTTARVVELQGGDLLAVGVQAYRSIPDLTSTGGWASAVLWRTGGNAWSGLRDSGAGLPPLSGAALNNYIALTPATTHPSAGATSSGYCGECGQIRKLPDGGAELLYHDRDGELKFCRNRMTLHSYYPSTAMPNFTAYQLQYWTTSRRDTWE